MKLSIKDIIILSLLASILFLQEQVLSYFPNINLTVFIIVLYSKKIETKKTLIIIIVYCMFDNLFTNSLSIVYTPIMLIGELIIPLLLNTIFIKTDKVLYISLLGALFSLLYCWMFILPSVLLFHIDFFTYLLADFPYEISFAISSFLSILFLYNPCSKAFDVFLKKYYHN